MIRSLTFLLFCLGLATAQAAEVVAFQSDGVTLGGTLEMPENPVAGVVLLPVAGPTDRDLSLGPKKFFADLAAAFLDQGIASIRFDDRGVGESGGSWLQTGFDQRGRDACAAMELLAEKGIQSRGYLGMSEGGGVALYAHANCAPGDFLALLSTPVLSGRETLDAQLSRALEILTQIPPDQHQLLRDQAGQMLALALSDDADAAQQGLEELLGGPTGSLLLPPYGFVPQDLDSRVAFVRSPWYRSQIAYDVSAYLDTGSTPLKALYGELDQVIDPQSHLSIIQQHHDEVSVVPGLNHLMQQAVTGSPAEYMAVPGTIAPRVVRDLLAWIQSL
ncbi:MAG: alpha/beta hydrolase [Xanthomonadales bacterium]|nr:alpha/beta hydrolase [Xanthomonadales bacterium]